MAVEDLSTFWSGHWDGQYQSIPYEDPRSFTWYDSGEAQIPANECTVGDTDPAPYAQNAFYCGLDSTIVYDLALAKQNYADAGDFAIVAIIAHEWGHHLQNLIRNSPGETDQATFSLETELQADCFAGVYSQHAGISGAFPLNQADLQEAATTFYSIGGESELGWFEKNYHGTPQERFDAYNLGLTEGQATACSAYANYMADSTIRTGPYAIGYPTDATANRSQAPRFDITGGSYGDFTLQTQSFDLGPIESTDEAISRAFISVVQQWAPSVFEPSGTALTPIDQPENLTPLTQSLGIPGVAIGYSYEQTEGADTAHGYVAVHILGSGDALILDVFRRGPAPQADSDWAPVVVNALRAINSFRVTGAG